MDRYEESIGHFLTARGLEDNTECAIDLAVAYGRAGKVKESNEILDELKERSKREYVSPALLAAVYGALGEYDIAFGLLDRAYAERDHKLIYLKTEPIFDPLRSDSRFAALLKKIGLEK